MVAVVLAVGVPMTFGEAAASAAANGTVMAWGENQSGQLGDGTIAGPEKCTVGGSSEPCSRTPVVASALSAVSAISAGAFHGLASSETGTVMAWGDNAAGQLGNGTTTNSDVPVGVCAEGEPAPCAKDLSGVRTVSGGGEFSLALSSNGKTIFAWGDNGVGELGDGSTIGPDKCEGVLPCSTIPVAVKLSLPAGVTVESISTGGEYSLALLSNGTVLAWGANFAGELGDDTTTNSDEPVAVCEVGATGPCSESDGQLLEGVKAISAGEYHSLALLNSGAVVAWGDDYDGELGDGKEVSSDVPVAVCAVNQMYCTATSDELTGATAVSAGFEHSLALLDGGTVAAWGNNRVGQLGDGSATGPETCKDAALCSKTPVEVKELSGVTGISAGYWHSLALLGNETVMAWGENTVGQLGDGTTSGETCAGSDPCSTTPVAVEGLTGATAVSAGEYQSLALVSGAAPTVTCSAAGSTLSIATKGSATPTEPVIVTASEGNYVVSLGGVTQCTGTSYSVSTYTTVDGPSSGSVTFAPGTATGLTFTGASGAANTLDLVGAPTGLSVVAMNGDTSGSPGQLTITPAGGSPGSDGFSNVTIVDGAPSGSTTFEPGTTSGVAFTGGAGATNLVDLRGEPSGVFTVSVNADTPGSPGDLTITPAGGSPGIDSFSNVTIVDGATNGPTTFQPDQNLLPSSLVGAPPPLVLFVGNDPTSGGSVIDLGPFASPDSMGEQVTGLTVALNGDNAGGPGQVQADVMGTPVGFADFYGVNTVIGSSSLPTTLQPGSATGVTLINVTPAGQAVAFTSTPPSPATVGGSYAVSATGGGSGNSVMFSIDTSKTTAGACSSSGANGANISFVGTGACVIDANQAGSSEYQPALQVQQTITVTNPLQGAPPSAPTITSVTSGGGSSSTGSTASVLTPAQITALTKLIEGEITPSGKNVTITALLKSGVVSISFTVLQAGTAVIDWYEIPSGAHLAKKTKPKPVLVASGQQSFSTAGTATIKIKLTATGKRRLKHAKRLKLTAEGTFTPTGETPVSATKALVLER